MDLRAQAQPSCEQMEKLACPPYGDRNNTFMLQIDNEAAAICNRKLILQDDSQHAAQWFRGAP
jgi:hypothetical protein